MVINHLLTGMVLQEEARIQAAQLRGHRQLYEVKGPHRLLLVGEGGGSNARPKSTGPVLLVRLYRG